MVPLDFVVALFAVALLLAAGFLARRRTRDTGDFILGGRRLPWWLAGSAMVAIASNADSPLHQSGKIRRDGLGGAWFYWSQILAQLFHALVFSRLWRRAEIKTVVEFYEIRYSGRARVLGRVWSMVLASMIEGTLVLALGMLAMIKICAVLLGLQDPVVVAGVAVPPEILISVVGVILAISYSTAAGLLGVVAGDVVEFVIAMGCSYLLLFVVYREVGFAGGLREKLAAAGESAALSFTPAWGLSILVFLFVQPFVSLAGTNSVNQRFMAVKDERQAMLAGVWRIVNQYFIRGWPWYVCGLASIVLLTDAGMNREMAYPRLVEEYMPAGFRGLMFAGFLVAFMSSVGSSMHNSGSVFVNDFYRAYLVKNASEIHYVWAIRTSMLVFAALGVWIAVSSDQILGLLQIFLTIGSASGLVMVLRWFWWRVNGWADLSAQVLALPVTLFFSHGEKLFGEGADPASRLAGLFGGGSADDRFAAVYLLAVGTTTLLWLIVMAATRPEPEAQLVEFYRRIRPYGAWGPVRRLCPEVRSPDSLRGDLGLYARGLVMALGLLFGIGALLLAYWWQAVLLLAVAAWAGASLVRGIDARFPPDHQNTT